MTAEEENRFCAEALGYRFEYAQGIYRVFNPKKELIGTSRLSESVAAADLPDFFTSESANAMLRDAMIHVMTIMAWANRIDHERVQQKLSALQPNGDIFRRLQVRAFIAFVKAGGKVG